MLQIPIINRNHAQSFSFNQMTQSPLSPSWNSNNIINQYIKIRQRNLIDYIRSKYSSRKSSPVSKQQQSTHKKDSLPSPISRDYQQVPSSIGDSIQMLNGNGMTDETLFDEIIDLENAMDQSSSRQISTSSKQIIHSTLRKSITEDGLTKLNQYVILQDLGKGSFGKVKLAQDNQTKYAVKICDRKKLKLKLLSSKIDAYSLLDREIAIMKKIDHQNIVQLKEVIENPNNEKLYLILEYMDGDSLANLEQPSIELVWQLFRDFILGLEYLHNYANIAHMDIKPENLLLNSQMRLKIADFGVSQIMDDDIVKSKQGTSAYQPPEIFLEQQVKGKPVDVWAAGLTFYQLIYNKHPFFSLNKDQLKNNIINTEIEWNQNSDLNDLLSQMLCKNPNQRITCSQILKHPWITNYGKHPLKNNYTGNLDVNEQDLHNAITRLSFNMAIRTINKLKQKLNQSRQKIKVRKSQ